ncbi:MAG: N-6 DNA methylase, partial [Clostridia bacterium]|nr:N-6 DNA methylase [Clostridia bacterium]
EFSYEDSEELGNAFEYLLSIMGSQGDAGQFRTPRHIIDMMVEITAPTKNETILDPACGTAGFLISAYNYIKKSNMDEHGKSTLVADDMTRMTKNFAGYDISPDMVRLSRVNMYLHGFTSPNISEYDTLTSLEKWDDNFDVIFSNPPFMTPKGGITPHNRYQVSAKRAEVLFVDYIAEHLNPTGRAAIIVPEGIVFQSQTAYKNLRKMLVDDNYLYGVISLPAGVFNPYSGVKTSILLIDKTLAKERDSILFVKLNNDGFDLGAQRREIKGSEIPDVVNVFKDYQNGIDVEGRENAVIAKKNEVAQQDYILVGERYARADIVIGRYPLIKISDICTVNSGFGFPNELQGEEGGSIPFYKVSDMNTPGNESIMNHSNNYVSEGVATKQRWIPASSNTVIFPKIGAAIATNKKRMLSVDSLYDNNVMGITCSTAIKKEYLYYILCSIELSKWASQSNPPSIRKSTVEEYAIPLPPLAVQEEIVVEIESYQKIIYGARQVVENYKPTIKIDPTWEAYTLGDVCHILNGSTPSKAEVKYWEDGDIPWFTIDDIRNQGRRIYETRQFITRKALEETSVKLLPPKTVLLCCTASVGEYAIAEIPLTTNQQFNGLIIKDEFADKMLPDYLFYYAQYFGQSMSRLGGSTAFKFISVRDVKTVPIHIPSVDVQKKIVDSLNVEISMVEQNKSLIEIFRQKIKDKIAEVWGE